MVTNLLKQFGRKKHRGQSYCWSISYTKERKETKERKKEEKKGKTKQTERKNIHKESASALLSLQKLWSVDTVLFVTLSLTVKET